MYEKILVPVKIGPIGEEMLATAVKLAEERGATIYALHAIRVPLDLPLDAELLDQEERASASLIDAKLLAGEHGVTIDGDIVRARAIGEAIVEKAKEIGADLVVLGSAPAGAGSRGFSARRSTTSFAEHPVRSWSSPTLRASWKKRQSARLDR